MIRPQRGSVSEGFRSVGEAGKDIRGKLLKTLTKEKTIKKSNNATNNNSPDSTSNKTQHNKIPSSLDESSITQNIVMANGKLV